MLFPSLGRNSHPCGLVEVIWCLFQKDLLHQCLGEQLQVESWGNFGIVVGVSSMTSRSTILVYDTCTVVCSSCYARDTATCKLWSRILNLSDQASLKAVYAPFPWRCLNWPACAIHLFSKIIPLNLLTTPRRGECESVKLSQIRPYGLPVQPGLPKSSHASRPDVLGVQSEQFHGLQCGESRSFACGTPAFVNRQVNLKRFRSTPAWYLLSGHFNQQYSRIVLSQNPPLRRSYRRIQPAASFAEPTENNVHGQET